MSKTTTLIFRTSSDDRHAGSIAGVGEAGAHGKGGILVAGAAAELHELQRRDGRPLTGGALQSAAARFADARGFVLDVADGDVTDDDLRAERGIPRTPPAAESAEAEGAWHESVHVTVDPHDVDPSGAGAASADDDLADDEQPDQPGQSGDSTVAAPGDPDAR